jgi:predicted O-methyltransferase YrrM
VNVHVTEFELFCIAAVASAIEPARIVEFGTADGRTTLNLARNSPAHCQVVTINLPLEDDAGHVQDTVVGSRFLNTAESSRIVQIWGDTRTVDSVRPTREPVSWCSSTPIIRRKAWLPTASPR